MRGRHVYLSSRLISNKRGLYLVYEGHEHLMIYLNIDRGDEYNVRYIASLFLGTDKIGRIEKLDSSKTNDVYYVPKNQ